MAKKKLSRKELLKGPDEFLSLSTRAATFFGTHLRELKIIGIAVAIIVASYLSVYGYMRHINKKGQEGYNLAYETLMDTRDPGATPEKLKAAEALFEKVIDEYGMSKAARLALPQVGHVKFSEKKYDEAILYYDRFAAEVSGDKKYEDLTSLALAACYEAKGELKKAISILTPLLETRGSPFRETAMLNMERLYRLDNQPEKANEILQRFVKEYQTSPFFPMAKARL
ncbi:MAG: tetratricopeptide repeat protein [Deltaproteobacteria bacterium]|nr:tetratricopeptide repeat protein [Deltaproteobacteria bacterium]